MINQLKDEVNMMQEEVGHNAGGSRMLPWRTEDVSAYYFNILVGC